MNVEQLPKYPSFSLTTEANLYPTNLPHSQLHGYHKCEHCSPPGAVDNEDMVIRIPIDDHSDQVPLEDAQLILGLGRSVNFTIVPDNDTFIAKDVVEALSQSPIDLNSPVTTIPVPRNKVTSFYEALREHLVQRSRRVVERAGRLAFWSGREPFMRPALSRSLSLP